MIQTRKIPLPYCGDKERGIKLSGGGHSSSPHYGLLLLSLSPASGGEDIEVKS